MIHRAAIATAVLVLSAAPALAQSFTGVPRFVETRPAAAGEVPGVSLAYGEPATGPAQAEDDGFRAWAQYVRSWSRLGADRNGAAVRSSSDGMSVGVERLVDPTLVLGVAFGYARGRSASAGVSSDTETMSGAAYLWWNPVGGFEVDALLGASAVDADIRRSVTLGGAPATLGGSAGGVGVNALAAVGYRFRFEANGLPSYLKPFASVSYADQDRGTYAERAGGGGLVFAGRDFERSLVNLGGVAGFDAVTPWGWTVRPEVSLAWSRHLIDPSPLVRVTDIATGRSFALRDPRPGNDGALVGAELTAWRTAGLQGFVGYAGEFRSNATAHQVRVGLRASW